jgi:cell wall-associated NlpC family hydrolase
MDIEEFAIKAVSVPFKPHGRDWDGWDCWGLVYLAYKEVLGKELFRYDNDYQSVKDRELLQQLFTKGIEEFWKETNDIQSMDGIMYYAIGRVCHVGLAVDDKMMLHTEHGTGTTYEKIKNFRRIEGVYRYVGN